jgi:hypothetical protein
MSLTEGVVLLLADNIEGRVVNKVIVFFFVGLQPDVSVRVAGVEGFSQGTRGGETSQLISRDMTEATSKPKVLTLAPAWEQGTIIDVLLIR